MAKEYRLIHFNSARPIGTFSLENEFVRVFLALLPRVFTDANEFDGLIWHQHGVRRESGDWVEPQNAFPHPVGLCNPDICTMAGWRDVDALKEFSYSGRTHPPSMKRLATEVDRSHGATFVMWWAERGDRVTLEDGWNKLVQLRTEGPSSEAFTLDTLAAHPAAA